MEVNIKLAEYRDEIDRLRRFAKKLEELGMEDKAKSHKLLIDDLRKRLDKLELQYFWEADDEYL
jgi:aspartate aminotransferase-like enzyme